VYRIPMSNILGEEGNGIYAVAFEIYDLILIISSYSLPLALSKMISARQANREHKNTGRILKVALRFAIISGGALPPAIIPTPPPLETAAAKRASATQAIPPCIIGYSIPSNSQILFIFSS